MRRQLLNYKIAYLFAKQNIIYCTFFSNYQSGRPKNLSHLFSFSFAYKAKVKQINENYKVQNINWLQSIRAFKFQSKLGMSMVINSCLLYILTLKKQLRRFAMVWILILPFQTFFLITLSIQSNLSSSSSDLIASAFANIQVNLVSSFVSKVCSLLGFIITTLLIFCFAIYLILKKPNNELDKYGPWLHKLILVSVALVYAFQFIVVQLVWNLKTIIFNVFQTNSTSISMYWPLLWLAFIVFVGILNHRIRIFGFYIILLIFVINESEMYSIVVAIMGILLGLHLIKNDEQHDFLLLKSHNLRKILHLTLVIFYLWKLVEHFLGGIHQNLNLTISYIYLCFMVAAVVVLGFFLFVYKINHKLNPVVQLCECLLNLQQNPSDTQSKILSMQIVNDYFKLLHKKKEVDEYLFELKTKKQKDWKTQDWHYLVNLMIKQEYEKEPSLQSGIKMLKCRLMIKDGKIFQIIQLLKDLAYMEKSQDITRKYQVLKITLKTQEIYFKKYQAGGHSISHIIRQVDKLNQNFYRQCCTTVSLLYQFWINVVGYKISLDEEMADEILTPFTIQSQKGQNGIKCQNNMEKMVLIIRKQIKKLQKLLKQIKSISTGRRQSKALNCIRFLATYTQNNQDDVSYAQSNLQVEKSQSMALKIDTVADFSQYFEVIDSKVTKISLKLATQLGYRKLQAVGENLNFLMPKLYKTDMDMAISNHNEPFLKVSYLTPLICSDNSILLKNIDIHIELDCLCGYRTIYQMRNNQLNKDPVLIYNIERNIIEFYNKAFITQFKIDKAKLDSKIRSELVNPDDIFKDLQLNDKSIQIKLSQSGLESQYNCRINLQQLSEKRNSKLENVRLSLIEREKNYMILKVMKGYRMKSIVGNTKRQITKKSIFSSFNFIKNDSSLPINISKKMKVNANSTFCRIENPYESKLNTKKIQLNKQSKITLKTLVILLLSVSIVLLVAEGLTFLQINLQINNAIKQESHQSLNMLNLYTELMLAFQSHYKYQLSLKNREKIENLSIDYKNTINSASQQIEEHVKLFQQNYLDSLKYQSHGNLEYSIDFQNLTFATDTTTTNLFDFSQNLLLYGNEDSLNFLIKNYPSFISLSSKALDTFSIVQDKISKKINIQYIVSAVVLGLILICLILSTLINAKIQDICNDIKQIFRLMKKDSMSFIFISLNSITKKFLELGEINHSLESKYKYALNSYLSTQQKQGQSVATSHDPQNEKQNNLIFVKQNEGEQKQFLNKEKLLNEKQKKKKKISCWSTWGYLLVMFSLGCIKVVQIFYFNDRVQMQYQIMNFQIQNKMISSHLISRVLQTQYVLLLLTTKNTTNSDAQLAIGETWLVNNKKLPAQYFDQFSKAYFNKIYGDLCITLDNKSLVAFNSSECERVGNTLFAYGVPVSIQSIYQILIESIDQNLSYWFSRRANHSYAVYQQVFMAQQLVIAINNEVQNQLNKNIDSFHQLMNFRVYQIFILSCIFSLGLLIMLFKIKSEIYRMGQVGIGYFLIAPKKVLLEDEVLTHIRKNQLLNRIDFI